MPKFPEDHADRLYRYIKGEWWVGYDFTESKPQNRALAKYLRSNGIPARAFILRETFGMNFGMQAPERYVVYVHRETLKERDDIDRLLVNFYKSEKDMA